MLRFLADENLNNDILRGLRRRNADIDIVRVQDVGLIGAEDPDILEWAAQERRVVVTHDVATVTHYAYERVKAGRPMPGVCEIPRALPVGRAVEDLELVAACSFEEEWENQVRYLPLKA